jgi:hypothetical protein
MSCIYRAAAVFTLAILNGGCGANAGVEYAPAAAQMKIALRNPSQVSLPTILTYSMAWGIFDADERGFIDYVFQGLGAQPLGLEPYQVVDLPLPPERAMQRLDPREAMRDNIDPSSYRFATGSIFAFEDRNGNGSFERAPLNPTSTDDRMVGGLQEAQVWFIDGTPPPPKNGVEAVPGFFMISSSPEAVIPIDAVVHLEVMP